MQIILYSLAKSLRAKRAAADCYATALGSCRLPNDLLPHSEQNTGHEINQALHALHILPVNASCPQCRAVLLPPIWLPIIFVRSARDSLLASRAPVICV